MVYLIYGNQNIRIKSQLKAIVKKVLGETDELNYVKFDFFQTPLKEILDDVSYLPLGYERKIVAVENCLFLSKDKFKDKLNAKEDFEELKSTVSSKEDSVDLILLMPSSNLDKNNEIYAFIEKEGKVFYIEDPDSKQWIEVVKMYINKLGTKIDPDALKELSDRTAGDYASLYSNGQKLSLYTEHIKYDDVLLMVTRPLEENSFQIFNHLLNNENILAISVYKDLRVSNIEPVVIIAQLASQFRTLGETLYLCKKGLDNDSVAKELGIKPIRVQIMKKYLYIVSESCIRKTLNNLYKLDSEIKSGLVDRYYAFELFLINFNRN